MLVEKVFWKESAVGEAISVMVQVFVFSAFSFDRCQVVELATDDVAFTIDRQVCIFFHNTSPLCVAYRVGSKYNPSAWFVPVSQIDVEQYAFIPLGDLVHNLIQRVSLVVVDLDIVGVDDWVDCVGFVACSVICISVG